MNPQEYIESHGKFGIRLGLENIKILLSHLGNPQNTLKFIHVGGTNGKGSTCTMLESIFRTCGYTTGLYTSPALMDFGERIRLNNQSIQDSILGEVLEQIKEAEKKMMADGHPQPTCFEIETALALLFFHLNKVDICIMEVGMGGRLDATNIIPPPLLTIITTISYDHTQYLGDTLQAIAEEKAGIIKSGTTLILHPQMQEAYQVFDKKCAKLNVKLVVVPKDGVVSLPPSQNITQEMKIKFWDGEIIEHGLLGTYQSNNTAGVLLAVEILSQIFPKLSKDGTKKALESVRFPGRFEILQKNPIILIDGAHNLGGIESFISSYQTYFDNQPMNLFFGMLEDKEIIQSLQQLLPLTQSVYTLTPQNERAIHSKEMAKLIEDEFGIHAHICSDSQEALQIAKQSPPNSINAFIGSLYLIGEIRKAYYN